MNKFAEKVRAHHAAGIWTDAMVRNAVAKGRISQDECDKILHDKEHDDKDAR